MAGSLLLQPMMLSPHQEAMEEACKADQVAELQKLFAEHDVKPGDDPIPYWHATQKGAPATGTLFVAAISRRQQSIVQYLRSAYPKFDFYTPPIIHALTAAPDLEMLKLIHSYSPRIVNFGFDDHVTTLLSKACEGGPQNAPFVDFLLDHGAMADDFGSYTYQFGGELVSAIQHDQPTQIIQKMIPKTSRLWFPIDVAIRRKRVDVLELLLNEEEKRGGHSCDGTYEQALLRNAHATADKNVIALVERFAANFAARGLQSTIASTESRRWWQCGARADSKNHTDAGHSTSAPRTGAGRWWWPLSKVAWGPKSADYTPEGRTTRFGFSSRKIAL
ncbi:hypothetical protein G647_04526 [Cladophialophora carrionii CBS 160.54]|uniref:Uncharacterized protein n=1 Tax=Cladophialophora carrionii CBS 160.54 TaxID=1279043 RepID=V9DFP8_9EURO|nr:uncharacterized protein G647_04526 [Cladophialophora carrionii CBS 160.54]ETI25153.1 hypothetical protein G647_04526 [Cladophialophora carrionii CBS 160.54]